MTTMQFVRSESNRVPEPVQRTGCFVVFSISYAYSYYYAGLAMREVRSSGDE